MSYILRLASSERERFSHQQEPWKPMSVDAVVASAFAPWREDGHFVASLASHI